MLLGPQTTHAATCLPFKGFLSSRGVPDEVHVARNVAYCRPRCGSTDSIVLNLARKQRSKKTLVAPNRPVFSLDVSMCRSGVEETTRDCFDWPVGEANR